MLGRIKGASGIGGLFAETLGRRGFRLLKNFIGNDWGFADPILIAVIGVYRFIGVGGGTVPVKKRNLLKSTRLRKFKVRLKMKEFAVDIDAERRIRRA